MAEQVSIFKLFSVGQVSKPKERASRHIQAVAVEVASATDGETTHAPQENILKGTNSDGTEYQVKVTSTRDMECEWLPMEGNRATPPDVERGELVMIYRLGDTDQYFWTCMGLRQHLRTLECVITMYGATPDLAGCGLDFSKCYYSIWSPLDGHITFATSQANKEKFKYTFQINTKDSFAAMSDDVGNMAEINSADSRVMLKNVNNSMFRAEKQIIDVKADKEINLPCGGSTIKMTPNSITTKTTTDSKEATTITRKGSTITDESGSYTNKATTWSFV